MTDRTVKGGFTFICGVNTLETTHLSVREVNKQVCFCSCESKIEYFTINSDIHNLHLQFIHANIHFY